MICRKKISLHKLAYRSALSGCNSCVIYISICSCSADFIGETIRNVKIKWNEHKSGIDKNSEFFNYLQEHLSHDFKWSVL